MDTRCRDSGILGVRRESAAFSPYASFSPGELSGHDSAP